MIRFAVAFLVLALSVVSAETHWLNIYQPTYIAGQELRAGEYKLEVEGDKLTITKGKLVVEAKVKAEPRSQKVQSTRLVCQQVGDKLEVNSIQLKGSMTDLVVQ